MEGRREGGREQIGCSVRDCEKRPRHTRVVINAKDDTFIFTSSRHVGALLGRRTVLTTTPTWITTTMSNANIFTFLFSTISLHVNYLRERSWIWQQLRRGQDEAAKTPL